MTFIVHHHIYKNAGTTVDWILHRNFPGRVLHIEGPHPGARLSSEELQSASADFPEHLAITSHCAPLPESAWAARHITMLRDPVRRIYSMYQFDKRRADEVPSSKIARQTTFSDYCEWWLASEDSLIRNWQVRCCTPQEVTGGDFHAKSSAGWNADLYAAKEAIESSAVAGVVERFDESMIVIEAEIAEIGLSSFNAAYLSQNVSERVQDSAMARKKWTARELLEPSLEERLRAANALDYELLEHGHRLLDMRLRRLPDLQTSLAGFRQRCWELACCSTASQLRVPGRDQWIIAEATIA